MKEISTPLDVKTQTPTWKGHQTDELSTARVLVVDDEPEALRSVARILSARGMEVQTATNGLEALGRLEQGDLDDICKLANDNNMAIYLGIIERAENRGGHSLYCSLGFHFQFS